MSLLTSAPNRIFMGLRAFNLFRFRRGPFCLFALLTVFFGFTSRATVYVLDPPPPGQPARLLQVALNHAENGDTILLRRGIYPLQPAYPSGQGNAPLQIVNKTNIIIQGLEDGAEIFSAGPGELMMISDSSSIRLERITFRSNRAPVQNGDWLYSLIQL